MINIKQVMKVAKPIISILAIAVPIASSVIEKTETKETIAKEVAKEFKDIYPEIIEQSNFSSYDNIIFINMCASSGIFHAESARTRAESYSSGGGGFSSGGGGGGSFGGGGGGGGFR